MDAHFWYVPSLFTISFKSANSDDRHVSDQRNPPPLGRIPSPDDIIASVRVEDGVMLPETYEPMPSYRVCTADGVCLLSDGLAKSLEAVIKRVSDEEQQIYPAIES